MSDAWTARLHARVALLEARLALWRIGCLLGWSLFGGMVLSRVWP